MQTEGGLFDRVRVCLFCRGCLLYYAVYVCTVAFCCKKGQVDQKETKGKVLEREGKIGDGMLRWEVRKGGE